MPGTKLAAMAKIAMQPPSEAAPLERLLSIREVAEVLGISRPGVYRLMEAGELAPVKVRGRTLFEPAVVREFIARNRQEAG